MLERTLRRINNVDIATASTEIKGFVNTIASSTDVNDTHMNLTLNTATLGRMPGNKTDSIDRNEDDPPAVISMESGTTDRPANEATFFVIKIAAQQKNNAIKIADYFNNLNADTIETLQLQAIIT